MNYYIRKAAGLLVTLLLVSFITFSVFQILPGNPAYIILGVDADPMQIEALNKMAAERGQSLAQMALSWILKDEDVTSVLIGASRAEQIIQNVEIVQNTKFTREELKKIDQISRGDL